jgi:serine/threonine-protein kinase
MVEAQKQWLKTREVRRTAREATAGDLRRQIGELRDQLARYAEALEEDLSSGREKVALRTREGLKYEKSFADAFSLLTNHLKGKPECRDLMNELNAGTAGEQAEGATEADGPAPAGARAADG